MRGEEPNVGAKIRAFRKAKGLSLVELSKRTGIAPSNLSSIELNKSSPTLSTLLKIAHAFEMRLGEWLDEALYSKATLCSGAVALVRGLATTESAVHHL
jgi:transcriptional regulator with XRE-family HTH domain